MEMVVVGGVVSMAVECPSIAPTTFTYIKNIHYNYSLLSIWLHSQYFSSGGGVGVGGNVPRLPFVSFESTPTITLLPLLVSF